MCTASDQFRLLPPLIFAHLVVHPAGPEFRMPRERDLRWAPDDQSVVGVAPTFRLHRAFDHDVQLVVSRDRPLGGVTPQFSILMSPLSIPMRGYLEAAEITSFYVNRSRGTPQPCSNPPSVEPEPAPTSHTFSVIAPGNVGAVRDESAWRIPPVEPVFYTSRSR